MAAKGEEVKFSNPMNGADASPRQPAEKVGKVEAMLKRVGDKLYVSILRAEELKAADRVSVGVYIGEMRQNTSTEANKEGQAEWNGGHRRATSYSPVIDLLMAKMDLEDIAAGAEESMRAELAELRPDALKRRAKELGVSPTEMNEADDVRKRLPGHVLEFSLGGAMTGARGTKFTLALSEGDFSAKTVIGVCEVPMSTYIGAESIDFVRTEWFNIAVPDSEEKLDISEVLRDRVASRALQKVPLFSAFLDFTFRPDSTWKNFWDLFILTLVLFSSFITPYDAAFGGDNCADENKFPNGCWVMDDTDSPQQRLSVPRNDYFLMSPAQQTYIDWLVDFIFLVDICLTFFTGFDRGFEVIMDKREIVFKYLRGWFAIDFVATVPWDKAVGLYNKQWASSKRIRLVRIVKVLRLARASRLIKRLTMSWTIHTKFTDGLKFMMYVFIVCHLLACGFFLLPELLTCDAPAEGHEEMAVEGIQSTDGWHMYDQSLTYHTCMAGSWRQGFGLEELCTKSGKLFTLKGLHICQETRRKDFELGLEVEWCSTPGDMFCDLYNGTFIAASCDKCMKPMGLWIDSMYWSLTTMTTIGYGDRGPQTQYEIVFVLFAEIFGLGFFAILLTQINTINDVLDETQQALNAQKDGVVQFLKHHEMDDAIVEETVRYLNFRATSLVRVRVLGTNAMREQDSA